MLSLIIPVFKNESCLERLFAELIKLKDGLGDGIEVVFVVDGSPDRCLEILQERIPSLPFQAQLISLSRNFGSFAAITAGLEHGRGDYFAVLAADLQEPPELIMQFLELLREDQADIVFGHRSKRSDPWFTNVSSGLFWLVLRKFVISDIPPGGVDIFACSRGIRNRILHFSEANTNLIALLFWMGFRRRFVTYERGPRLHGESSWTIAKKLRYCLDTIFNFTDLPVRVLLYAGMFGVGIAALVAGIVLTSKFIGHIPVPGYAATVLAILFFGGLNSLGLGILGQYLWLTLQNVRHRPNYIVALSEEHVFGCSGTLDSSGGKQV